MTIALPVLVEVPWLVLPVATQSFAAPLRLKMLKKSEFGLHTCFRFEGQTHLLTCSADRMLVLRMLEKDLKQLKAAKREARPH